MAAEEFINRLRALTNASTTMFSDTDLLDVLVDNTDGDGATNLNLATATVWEMKAGKYVELVDITEAGSSRKNGDLSAKALAMAKFYRGRDADDVAIIAGRPMTRAIVRPQ